MPSRRSVLSTCGLIGTSILGGCSMAREESKPVNVLLQNDDTEEWQLTVAVEDNADEEVFRTEETIPADNGVDLGEVRIEEAFSGTTGDQFTVQVWLAGKSAGKFTYEITCPDDNRFSHNRFSLLVEHRPYTPDDGEPVSYAAKWCAD